MAAGRSQRTQTAPFVASSPRSTCHRPVAAAHGFDGATGAVCRSEHKDFFWPPILKAFLILRDSLWLGVPQDEDPDNAFKIQWEMFLGHVAAGEPFPYDLLEGAKGVQLAALGLQSWRERHWLEVP